MPANTDANLPGRTLNPSLLILPLTGLALLGWALAAPGLTLTLAPAALAALQGGTLVAALLCALLALGGGAIATAYWPGLMALCAGLLGLAPWLAPATATTTTTAAITTTATWSGMLHGVVLASAALLCWLRPQQPDPAPGRLAGGILLAVVVAGLTLLLQVTCIPLSATLHGITTQVAALLLCAGLVALTLSRRHNPGRIDLGLQLCLLLNLGAQWGFPPDSAEFLLLQLLAWLALFAGLCPGSRETAEEQQRISQKVLMSLMADFQQAREEEAQAKQFAESIIENIPLMLFVKDAAELRFQRINKYGETLLGQNRDELIGKNDYSFFPGEQADFFTATDRAVLAGNDIVDIAEERITTGAGVRWLHTRKIPLRNSRGQPQFLLGISEDITARRELEQRITSLFEAAPNGLVLVNRDDRIVLANASACRLFGYDAAELIASHITLLIPARGHSDHAEHTRSYWSKPEARKMSGRPDLVALHRDGHEIPVEIALQPLPWLDQQHVLASITDVTERQRFISELEQASRYKSLFLANVSHELRTPMNSIIGFTEKVLKTADYLTPRHRDALETVQRNAHHLLSLISDILDLSKIEAGRMDVDHDAVDLLQFLEQARTDFTQMAKAKGLAFALVQPPMLPVLHTDRGKLVQICNNLLSNAVKYTERGTVTLQVETLEHDEIGAAVALHFRDTGIGIHPDDQQKLFKEFGRAQEAREKRIQGTGLGLLITAQLVALLGGRISFDSVHGEGSTFSVILPAPTA